MDVKPEIKHYATFLYPGALVAESETKEVETTDPMKIKVPDGCYGFYFFERTEATVNKKRLIGEPENHSPTYYPNGKVYTLADVKKSVPNPMNLISNMESNNWETVVETRIGNFQPYEVGKDIVLEIPE